MKYNFDKVIDRSGTSAEKVEGLKHIWGRTDSVSYTHLTLPTN